MNDVPYRGGGFQLRERRFLPLLGFAVMVAGWELASWVGALPALFMPAPHAVLRAFYQLLVSGKLIEHVLASLGRILLGWTLGTCAGLALGFAMGIFSVARALGMALTAALFPVPKIALLPLFILWFGIGEPSKVATIAFGVFFPTVVSSYAAVDHVPRNLIAMAQSFGLPARDIVRKVIVPGALPGVLAGFRISSSIALILVVAAEMIGAQVGIGAFVLSAGNLMLTDQLIAGVLVLSLLGLAASGAISALERRLLRWR